MQLPYSDELNIGYNESNIILWYSVYDWERVQKQMQEDLEDYYRKL